MLPSSAVSVTRLREAVRARVEATTRRAIAREVGLTHRGLELFLAGTSPKPKTVAKLLRWYEEQIAAEDGPPISELDAVRVLLRQFPRELRPLHRKHLLEFLKGFYSEADLPLPPSLVQGVES